MTELVVVDQQAQRAISLLDMEPDAMAAKATKIATVLNDIIEKQKLYTVIQGKKHVRVDAWCALGNFLGVVPRESKVTEHEDGSFTAEVELIRWADGARIGGASAVCSVSEKRWGSAEKYARRSMAVTRATGKAFRLAFSWIICLAGYQPTPVEEMPHDEPVEKPVKAKPTASIYTGTTEQQAIVQGILKSKGIPDTQWADVDAKLMNKPSSELNKIISELQQ